MDYGNCNICGKPVAAGSSFVDIGPTDWNDPDKPPSRRWVPVDEDLHAHSPFVLAHPVCFASEAGVPALVTLVDESHRCMRAVYDR